jgi:hypothetical protein
MIEEIDGRPTARTHTPLVDWMIFEGCDLGDDTVVNMNIDGAAGITHAAQGRDYTAFHGCLYLHRRCSPSPKYSKSALPGLPVVLTCIYNNGRNYTPDKGFVKQKALPDLSPYFSKCSGFVCHPPAKGGCVVRLSSEGRPVFRYRQVQLNLV